MNYIIGILLSSVLIFGSMGVGYYLRLVFTRLNLDILLLLCILCVITGLFFGETWSHAKTKKELKELKQSMEQCDVKKSIEEGNE